MNKSFTQIIRERESIVGAINYLTICDEREGKDTFAHAFLVAVENIQSDHEMVEYYAPKYSDGVCDWDKAAKQLIKKAEQKLKSDPELWPDAAIQQAVAEHQKRRFDSAESVTELAKLLDAPRRGLGLTRSY